MNKQIAQVDEYINDAAAHMAAISNILNTLEKSKLALNATQSAKITDLQIATNMCKYMILASPMRPKYVVKHTKLTTQQIIEYVNDAKTAKLQSKL